MFKFFETIFIFLGTLVDFVVSTVKNIVIMLVQVANGINVFGNVVLHYLPEVVAGIALAIVSYAVIVNVINKGG